MTTHEFALSDLAARLAGTDSSLSTSLRDILTVALHPATPAPTSSAECPTSQQTPEPETAVVFNEVL